MTKRFLLLFLVTNFFLIHPAVASPPRSCIELPRSAAQTQISAAILQLGLEQQGKLKWRDNGGATALEMQQAMQVAEDNVARNARNAEGDIAFLFVRSAGPKESPALAPKLPSKGGLTCFVRRGDTILLRDGASVHWTGVYAIDFAADVVYLSDPWPDRFPFLRANSAGDWNGELTPEGSARLIKMSGDELEKLLVAVVTIDEAALATRLAGVPCNCLVDEAAIRSIYDVLLNHGSAADLATASRLRNVMGKAAESELAKSYDAAASLLAGNATIEVEKSAAERVVSLAERRRYETFKDLSPHVILLLYEQTRNLKEPLDQIIKAAAVKASLNKEFTPLDAARRTIQTGRLYEADGDVGAAIDEVKVVVIQLAELYTNALEAVKNDVDPAGWRRGVHEKQALDTFKALIDAKAYLVVLYSRAHNLKAASRHFSNLLAVEAPFPVQILLTAAAEGCRADGRLERVAALAALDLKQPDAKTAISKLACFPPSEG